MSPLDEFRGVPTQLVRIINAPGFEDFDAVVIPGLGKIPSNDAREFTAVVMDADENLFVVPSDSVTEIPE